MFTGSQIFNLFPTYPPQISCYSDIAKHLSLPPVKLHCSMLAEDAIKAAVRDIQAKMAAAKEDAAAAKATTPGGDLLPEVQVSG